MATLGPSVAGTAANGIGIAVSWATTGNTAVSDNVYTTASLDASLGLPFNRSRRLLLTNFSPALALPAGGVVDGITVAIERKAWVVAEVRDDTLVLLSGGAVISGDKASAGAWPNADATATYGGAADTWGADFAAHPIDATFGVGIAVETVGVGAVVASIDLVTITVTYHVPAAATGPGVYTVTATGALYTVTHGGV